MRINVLCLIIVVFVCNKVYAQDSLWVRDYKFGAYNQYDLRNSSTNAISTHRILQDVFRKGIKPKMNENWGNLSYGIYSFATTFFTLIWSHEFGHSLRAKQVGGYFKIHNAAIPVPYTTMHLPDSISLINEALSVTGGFEVNAINTRSIQREFVAQNGIYNEDLSFSFVNRMMYPIYITLVVPIDPKEKDVWVNTAGDPVHIALPVFQNYSNNQVFLQDSIVNPDLEKYYNESALFSVFINLIDPQFYREFGAAFGKSKIRRPIFIIGDFENGWTYSTFFNTSPLGYELYFNNYLHVFDQKLAVYFKYGNPFKNNGIGISWIDFINSQKVGVSASIDIWEQDIFETGISAELLTNLKISKHFGLFVNSGYKTEGYVLGKQISEGFNLGFGITYFGSY